jgi:DNA polymerase V
LFAEKESPKLQKLMESMDNLNKKRGPSVKIATQGTGRKWKLRQEQLSPAYSTRWKEILEINT